MIEGTVQVTGPIGPTTSADTYSVVDMIFAKDGLRNVADQTERNLITYDRRRVGMIVGTQDDGLYWKLISNPSGDTTTSSDWSIFLNASGDTNTYITGGTLDGQNLILTRNDGFDIIVDLSDLQFTGNTSGDCISDLYVHNLGGCSPINILTDIIIDGNITPTTTTIQSELFSTLINFNDANGLGPYCGVYENNNVLYGTTFQGGSGWSGVLYKYDLTTSAQTILYEFDGATNGLEPYCAPIAFNGCLYGTTRYGGVNNLGILYNYDLTATTFSVLWNFTALNNGYNVPYGSLIEYNGCLYGTTNQGGLNNMGVIYEYNLLTSAQRILTTFNSTNGNGPLSGLLYYDNKFYGVTLYGGTDYGVLYEYDIVTSAHTVLHNFTTINGTAPVAEPIEYNGKLYGTTKLGGDNNKGVIYEYNLALDAYTVLFNFDITHGSTPYGAVAEYNGNLYGSTYDGGDNNYGVFYEYNLSTNEYTVLLNFDGTNGQTAYGSVIEANNILYGTTTEGGSGTRGILFAVEISSVSSYHQLGSVLNPMSVYASELTLNNTSITNISADSGLTENSDSYLATQKAVKSYVDNIDTRSYKIYYTIIDQNAPIASQTSGTFAIGEIWTINTYNANDDFSNMELISGVMNTNGCKFRATSDTPAHWDHSSDLSYDGAPYVVSTNSDGNLAPFENTIGNIVWGYNSVGNYSGTLNGAFPLDKTSVSVQCVPTTGYFTVIYLNDANSFTLQVSNQALVGIDGFIWHTPIEIRVYN